MPSNPVIQKRSLEPGYEKRIILFNDGQIDLYATFSWNQAKDKIVEIKFELINILETVKYKICLVHRCINMYSKDDDQVLIQLSSKTSKKNSDFTFKDSSGIEFINGTTYRFIFNVSSFDCEKKYLCELNGGTPETKDGAIIVSI